MRSFPTILSSARIGLEQAAQVLSNVLLRIRKELRPGVSTLELDSIAEELIRSQGAEPAFKGYVVDGRRYSHSLCISIDHEVVHGVPSIERKLEEGHIVSIDCGVRKHGYYADAAFTVGIGQISPAAQHLLKITEEALWLGIEQATPGKRVYDIAAAIQYHVERHNYSVVRELTGHGIGRRLHEVPSIPNFVPTGNWRWRFPNERLRAGQALAIEPMVAAGLPNIRVASDGWTVCTADNSLAAHFEHTVLVAVPPVVLTQW
ncbi:MAG: type I methionyl aminopeptidase [Candidatus Kapabacteria bacterium]|nr:type I methionyl aminopeptidase [Candidatus Kapabacteria bacterium]MCS7169674.1 type I methionyl aminopeptidase [Candidatus Kapabacteria bacterium]MDW7996152.1 type I methionyl aminopeptidase [Bacteroidota bacterium]MDW8224692.1 type I methionyl aminopeptidase [Bacteroidota bacterium]